VAATPAFRITVFGAGDPPPSPVTSVSAASLAAGFVAPESVVSAFGEGLAGATETANSLPLPTALGGVSVLVRDRAGIERLAPLFYASPKQVNYQLPPGTAAGEAAVLVVRSGAAVATGTAQVAAVAPALFSANASGRGVAAALAVRVKPDGSQMPGAIARFDETRREFVPVPIDPGTEGDQVFLTLFGTGIRFRDADGLVTATVGGAAAEVLYAGPQPQYLGLDQVNVRLAPELAGRGEVDITITVDGRTSNIVVISIR
jgi:uncharacterized protein (TIGR03437 family)